MGKIMQLNDALSNKIAAGEVVDRPASVVKELVENAIDANSTRIEIFLEEAGLSKIQIIDNGDGIEAEDGELAFSRHATSKIKDEHDLFRIRTLGFRGEALPSIASVSSVEIKTSTGEDAGIFLQLVGGEIRKKEPANSRKGTDISVLNLFFNTPARLKHMKTIHTELGNVSDVVNRLALAHPEVSFRFLHNGKKLLQTNGNGDVLQVLASIYGLSVAKQMIPVNMQSIDFTVTGYIAKPEITRASRNYISTIINGRFIKNFSIMKAVQQGYHTLLPIGRFPVCLLDIKMDPVLVDVNVHPSKLEVRLSKESELMELIENGIKKAFRNMRLIPEIQHQKKQNTTGEEKQQSFSFEHNVTPKRDWLVQEEEKRNEEYQHYIEKTPTTILEEAPGLDVNEEYDDILEKDRIEDPKQEVDRIPPLYPIGQMHGTYIVAQNENGMYLIDQHAAQERVKYEFYREKVGDISPEVQELLVPLTFEFTQSESIIITEHVEELKEVGVFLESFGPQSFIVRSHPQWFPKNEEATVIEEIIQQLLEKKKISMKGLREEAAIMMSCKGSIKANHHLRNDELFALLEALRKSTDPFTCPHGRPIIIHFSTYEIEKMFKRVM